MAKRLHLHRETYRRLDAGDLFPVRGGGGRQAADPVSDANGCTSVTLCDNQTCGTGSIKTSITNGSSVRTVSNQG